MTASKQPMVPQMMPAMAMPLPPPSPPLRLTWLYPMMPKTMARIGGRTAQKAGMQFVFHNHDYEFKPMEGSNGWTELMKGTDPKLVKMCPAGERPED